jgi:predicted  nucleic acid-binding Zn-ribbon protein
MISLFDTKQEDEAPKFRDVYRNRLHEIAYGPNGQPSEAATATATEPAEETPPPVFVAPEASVVPESETVPEPLGTPTVPEVEPFSFHGDMRVEALTEAMTVDSRKLAEEIAPKFVDAFTAAFEEMGRTASNSNGAISEVVGEMNRVSQHLQLLSGQMGAIRRLIDSLAATQRELSAQVSGIDAALREHEKIYLNLETGLKQSDQRLDAAAAQVAQINERLDAQAGAIRTLHETSREREVHRDDLRTALEKIQQIAGKLSPSGPLPDRL